VRNSLIAEQHIINEAFEKYLESYLSKEARQKIANHYGEEIASKAAAIYADAMNCSVDWRTATIDSALPVLSELLSRNYSWLSEQARLKIIGAFIMEWK
jgi:hypothetical protein